MLSPTVQMQAYRASPSSLPQSNNPPSPVSECAIDVDDVGPQCTMTVQPAQPIKHQMAVQSPSQSNDYMQKQLKSGFAVASFDFNDPSSLTAYFISTAVAKSHSAIWKRFISGLLAGCFVVFGCVFALVASGGLDPAFRAAYPAVPKLIIGATFPVCLLMIMLVGGDLFTGNCMYAAMGLFSGRIGLGNVANMLCVSFASNLMGILFFGYFLGYQTELFAAEPYNSWMVSIAVNKVKLSWGVVVLRGVGANAMVCVAVFMGCAARDALGRFVLAYAPITLFAVVGFEHVIANMAFIPISMYYGAPFSVRDYIVRSLIPATIGNIIGGSFLVGAFCAYLYSKPRQSTFGEWLHYVCVPDVEVKEWFKELYLQLLNDRPIKENAAVKTLEAPVKTIK